MPLKDSLKKHSKNMAVVLIFGALQTTLAQQGSALPTLEDLKAVSEGYPRFTDTDIETLLKAERESSASLKKRDRLGHCRFW